MNESMVSEDNAPFRKLMRPVVKALRTAYIQGTTVVKLMPSERAIQLYYKYRRKSYDLQWSLDPGYRKGLRKLVELAVEDGDAVLDVGCGTASASVVAAPKCKTIVGIDLSPDMIELGHAKIRKRAIDNCTLIATSVETSHTPGITSGNLCLHVQFSQTRWLGGTLWFSGRGVRRVRDQRRNRG